VLIVLACYCIVWSEKKLEQFVIAIKSAGGVKIVAINYCTYSREWCGILIKGTV
jgi:hypothetical protein